MLLVFCFIMLLSLSVVNVISKHFYVVLKMLLLCFRCFLHTVFKMYIFKSSFYLVVLRRSWRLKGGFFHWFAASRVLGHRNVIQNLKALMRSQL